MRSRLSELRCFATCVGGSGIVLALPGCGRTLSPAKGRGEAMIGSDGSQTFWLDFTNVALGLVTLICVIAIVAGVVHELGHRFARGRKLADDHAFHTPELGVTMADGGERVDRK
jgi:hypothetical protein